MSDPSEVAAQYQAMTEAVGYVDVSVRSLIRMEGNDRASFLHNMCTNEINKLGVGQGVEAFLTSVQGKTLGHIYAFAQPDAILLETVPGRGESIIEQLEGYHFREDVVMTDQTAATSKWIVSGTNATDVLRTLASDVPDETLANVKCKIEGNSLTIIRTALAHVPAYELITSLNNRQPILDALEQAGSVPCDRDVWDVLRIEGGLPEFGRDIHETHLPQEVDRNVVAISFVKGCYIGQETIARIDALGQVNHLLVGVVLSEPNVQVGCTFTDDGKAIGELTSIGYSPRLQKAIGLARVRRGHHTPGTTLHSEQADATVQAFPLV